MHPKKHPFAVCRSFPNEHASQKALSEAFCQSGGSYFKRFNIFKHYFFSKHSLILDINRLTRNRQAFSPIMHFGKYKRDSAVTGCEPLSDVMEGICGYKCFSLILADEYAPK